MLLNNLDTDLPLEDQLTKRLVESLEARPLRRVSRSPNPMRDVNSGSVARLLHRECSSAELAKLFFEDRDLAERQLQCETVVTASAVALAYSYEAKRAKLFKEEAVLALDAEVQAAGPTEKSTMVDVEAALCRIWSDDQKKALTYRAAKHAAVEEWAKEAYTRVSQSDLSIKAQSLMIWSIGQRMTFHHRRIAHDPELDNNYVSPFDRTGAAALAYLRALERRGESTNILSGPSDFRLCKQIEAWREDRGIRPQQVERTKGRARRFMRDFYDRIRNRASRDYVEEVREALPVLQRQLDNDTLELGPGPAERMAKRLYGPRISRSDFEARATASHYIQTPGIRSTKLCLSCPDGHILTSTDDRSVRAGEQVHVSSDRSGNWHVSSLSSEQAVTR